MTIRHIYFLIFLFILNFTETFSQCHDSTMVILHQSQEDNDPLTNDRKIVYKFNAYEKPVLKITFSWVGNNWQPFSKDSMTYFHDTLVESHQLFKYLNNQWTPFSRENYQYINDTLVSYYSYKFWNSSNWRDSIQETYTYNSFWLLTDDRRQYSNGINWYGSFDKSTVYDALGNKLSYTFLNYQGSSQKVEQDFYYYDGTDDTLFISQYGTSSDTLWHNNQRHRQIFSSSHQLLIDEQAAWNNQWMNQTQIHYFYTGNSVDADSGYAYSWNNNTLSWELSQRGVWQYDADGHIIYKGYSSWDGYFWNEYQHYIYQFTNGLLNYTSSQFGGAGNWTNEYSFYFYYDVHGHFIGRDGHYIGFGASGAGASFVFDNNGIWTNASGWWSTMGGFTGSWNEDVYYGEINGPDEFCSDDSVILSVDSCPGATYLWSTGATTPSITVSTTDTITVNVTYPNGYHASTAPLFVEAQSHQIFQSATDSIAYQCGSRALNLGTVAQSYTFYQWYKNDTLLTGQVYPHLYPYISGYSFQLPGNYYCIATNLCGIDTSATTTIIHSDIPPDSLIYSSPPFCIGDIVTLSSLPGYSYSWYPSGDTTVATYATADGLYYVIITNTAGCTTSNYIHLTFNPSPSVPVIYSDGPNVVVTDSLAIQWFRNDTLLSGNPGVITNAPVGDYYIIRTNSEGCTSVSDTLHFTTGMLTAQAGPDKTVCNGDTVTLGVNNTAYGGHAPYTFHWSPSTGLSFDSVSNPHCFANSTTSYILSVTDSTGSIVYDTILVTVHPTPNAVITHDPVPVCPNVFDFTVTALPAGEAQYKWTLNGGFYSSGWWNTIDVNNNVNGAFQVTITDSFGCKGKSAPDTITHYPWRFLQLNPQGYIPICNGDSIALHLTYDSSMTYTWSFNNSIISSAHDTLLYANQTGNYVVTATTIHGCTQTGGVYVNEDSVLHIYSNPYYAQSICDGDSVEVVAANISGYTYQWRMWGVNIPGATTANFTATQTGQYSVYVQSPAGCSGISDTADVNVYPLPTANYVFHNDTIFLFNYGNIVSFDWYDDSTNNYLGSNNYIVVPPYANEYSVMLRGSGLGCYNTLVIPYTPCPVSVLMNHPNCNYDSSGEITILPGGISPFSIQWSNGDTISTRMNLSPGIYYCTISDSSGCINHSTITLTSISNLKIDSMYIVTDCAALCNDSLVPLISGSTTPLSFIWQDNSTSEVFTNACSGTYDLQVTDSLGCVAERSFTFTEDSGIIVTQNVLAASCGTCADGSIMLTVNSGSPYSISWQPHNGTLSGTNITGLISAIYTITLTTLNGCQNTIIDTVQNGLINKILKPDLLKCDIYPNPLHHSAELDLSGNWDYTMLTLNVKDPFGRIEKIIAVHSSRTLLHFDELPSGVYFYSLNNAEHIIAVGKLIIQ